MKLEVTPAQLRAIRNLTDDCAAMSGGGDVEQDEIWWRYITLIDRMLTKNGHPREYMKEQPHD